MEKEDENCLERALNGQWCSLTLNSLSVVEEAVFRASTSNGLAEILSLDAEIQYGGTSHGEASLSCI